METKPGLSRLALEAHGKAPNEDAQEYMGWMSFVAREANGEVEFEDRLTGMNRQRWAGKVFGCMYSKGFDTA